MKSFLLKSYTELKDALLISFFGTVLKNLEGNAFFNEATALITALKDKLELYSHAYKIAVNGTPAQKETRNTLRMNTIEASEELTCKLEAIANGNRHALLTTGYKLSKDFRTPVVIEPLKSFEVMYGQMEGQLIAIAKKGKGKSQIVYQYSLDTELTVNTRWIATESTAKSAVINNLPVGKMVWVRAGVLGSKEQAVYCMPIAMKVR